MDRARRWPMALGLVVSLVLLTDARPAPAQTLSGGALVKALRQGGYVLVMRHASSPREAPSKEAANKDNVTFERQLDEHGRETAAAMGKAMRGLKIPLGEVLTSPTYRARETVRLAQWANAQPQNELGDGGQNMQAVAAAAAAWLQKKVTQFPKGSNALLVTHLPNLTGAFPQWGKDVVDGETLVFGPDGKGGATLVGRIKIEEWASLHD
jgi:phosphohistidine phosphatase SixA